MAKRTRPKKAKKERIGREVAIKDAKIYDVYDLWRRKPRGLFFNDNDVIIITTSSGIKEAFYTCLKGDGTFSIKTPNRTSQAHRQKLADFIKYYFNIENPEEYNVREGVKNWEGKKVKTNKNGFIYIP